jgi:hypothetical protein
MGNSMKNSKTPKIVVGTVLVAVYATALGALTLRDDHESVAAHPLPSVASAPHPINPPSSVLAVPDSADILAPQAAVTPATSVPAVTSAPTAGTVAVVASEVTRPQLASAPTLRAEEVPVSRMTASTPPPRNDAEESNPGNSGIDTANESAATSGAVAGESGTSATEVYSGNEAGVSADASTVTN